MMRLKHSLTSVLVATLSLVGLTACGNNHSQPQVVQQGPTTTQTSVETKGYLLDTTKFDLGLVRGLVQSGKVSNPADLEKAINDRSTGINNVDVDGDGNTDFVGVQEKPSENGKIALSFVAQPSSGTGVPVEIAEISITQNTQTNEVKISGEYSHHIVGYDTYHAPPKVYHHNDLSFAEAYLLVSLMRPHSPYMYHYNPYYYTPRPIMTPTAMSTTRSSYTTTNKVTTVSPVSRTTTVNVGSNNTTYAPKTTSSLASPSKATGGSTMSSYSGSMKSYTVTDPSKKTQTVSAFSAPATTTSKPATTSSSSWGSTSSTAAKTTAPTSSWGSSTSTASKPATTTSSSSWGSTSSSASKPATTSSSWGSSSNSSASKPASSSSSWGSSSRSSSSRRR